MLISIFHYGNIPCSMFVKHKQNYYRITKTAITTPTIKIMQVPTAPPTVAERIFAEDVGIAS